MPNHVAHFATLYGKPETIAEIKAVIDNDESLMEHYLPLSCGEWDYDVACEEWGSKWGDYETQVTDDEESDDEVNIVFQSAWGPLRPGLDRLSEALGLTIVVSWIEEQPAFCEWAIIENGITITKAELDVESLHNELDAIEDDDERMDVFMDRYNEMIETCTEMAEDAYARLLERRKEQVQ